MVESTADMYKKRLIDISWFMRSLNDLIARQASKVIAKPEDTLHLFYK
jgi:hypothetical protein